MDTMIKIYTRERVLDKLKTLRLLVWNYADKKLLPICAVWSCGELGEDFSGVGGVSTAPPGERSSA
jgi:hypothetical protein